MPSSSITLVQSFYDIVSQKLKELQQAKQEQSAQQLIVTELERQESVHKSRSGQQAQIDLADVRSKLAPAKALLDIKANAVKQKQDEYEEAEKQYQEKYNSLLSTEQQKEIDKANAVTKAQNENILNQIDSTKNAIQKTTKYLIWGGIILIVIAIGVVVLRKNYA